MNPFSLSEHGGCELTQRDEKACSEGRTEPGRGTSSAVLVGNDQEANPTAHGPMALLHLSHLSTQAQSPAARSDPISQEGYEFEPIKERQHNGTLQRPSGVPASALGQSWVGWVGLKTQAMIPRRVMLELKWQQVCGHADLTSCCLQVAAASRKPS